MAEIEFGLPEAGRSAKRDQTRGAQQAYSTSAHAHVPVCAGETEDLVGYSDADIGSIRKFLGQGVAKGPHVRAAVVLVPVQAQSQGSGGPRSCFGRCWNALSSGISALRRVRPTIIGAGSAGIPPQTDETDGDVAVRGGSNV